MNKEKYLKAKELQREIDMCEVALNCFCEEHELEGEIIRASREPRLVIEHINEEWDGRTHTLLPFSLSEEFVSIISEEITHRRDEYQREFDNL